MVGSNLAWAVPIVIDGNTRTVLNVNGNVTDITTSTVKGSNAFNSFNQFNVNQNKTVNLHVPNSANNLVNLVHGAPSHINGVLNSYKNGQIGGNVFFANPYGMVVGSQGVVNVGSLTAVTPTHEYMNSFFLSPDNPSGAATQQLLNGSAPINPDGYITVQGQINAQTGIRMLAGTVSVAATGQLVNTKSAASSVPVLSDIVNTDGIESATQIVEKNGEIYLFGAEDVQIAGEVKSEGSQGIAGGDITVKSAKDITIVENALISVKGNGANSDGGNIIVFADNDSALNSGAVLDASAGSSGDGGFVELSAVNTVNINGGDLKASSDAGKSGSILIDPDELLWTGDGQDWFKNGETFRLWATKKIVLDDVFLSSRKVYASDLNRTNIITALSTGDSGDITIDAPVIELKNGTTILAHANNGKTGGKVSLIAHDEAVLPSLGWATATSQITIDAATIKANEVLIDAKSNIDSQFVYSSDDPIESTVNIASASAQAIGGFIASLGGVELVVSDVTANSSVNINSGANIESATSVTLSAENVTKAGLAKRLPSPGSQFDTPLGIGALWVSDTSDADVTVESGATIKAADLDILAHNNANMEGSIASGQNQTQNSNFTAIAASLTKADVQANATVEQGANLEVSGDLKVSATNVGSYVNNVTSKTGPNGRAAAAIAYADHQSGVNASLNANVGDATNVEVVAINDVVKDQVVATSKVGGTEFDSAIAKGKEKVKAFKNAESVFWSKLGLNALTPENKSAPTQQKFRIGGAIAYNTSTHNALAEIGDSTNVHASESIAVLSRVLAKDMKIAAQAAAISTAADKPAANDTSRQAYSVGLALGDFTHDAISRVGVDAQLTAPKIAVYSDTVIPIRDSLLFGSKAETDKWDRWNGLEGMVDAIESITNIFDVFNGVASAKSTSDKSSGSINLAGSVGILNYSDNSRAILEKGATLNLSGSEKGPWTKSFELAPEVKKYDDLTGAILLSTTPAVIEEFSFNAAATVEAKRDATLLFLAGRLPSASGEKGLGISFNQISIDSITEAIVREGAVIQGIDELASAGALGSRTWTQTETRATEEFNVSAINDERIWNLAAGGGYGASYGINGNVTQMELTSATHALVDDEVQIQAKKISVIANASPVLWSIAGTVNSSKNVSVGIGVAINDVETSVRSEIADNDEWSIDDNARSSLINKTGTKISSPDLSVTAKTSGNIEAIAVTGSLANDAGDPPGTPGIADKIKGATGITFVTDKVASLVSLEKSQVETSDTSQASQEKNKKPASSKYGLSGAGSGSINVTEMSTSARIEGVTIDQADPAGHTLPHSLVVRSISDSDLIAAAGAAAITRANNNGTTGGGSEQTKAVAIAGSLAINSLGNGNEAWIKDSTITNVNDVVLQALSGGEQLAVGLGMAIDATKNYSVKNSKVFAGSVSITESHTDDNGDSKNKTVAKLFNSIVTGESAVTGRNVEVTAYNRSYIGTGAGSLAVRAFGGKAKGQSVGGAVSWANIRNDVISGIYSGSVVTDVDTVDVRAFNATEIAAGAAMGGYNGAKNANSFGASVVANQITNNTTAAIDRSKVTATGHVNVTASDQGADAALETIIDPDGERDNTVAGLDYCGESAGGASPTGNCITAVAGTVQAGRGNNVGFSVSYNSIVNNLTAKVMDSAVTVTGTDVTNAIKVSADSDTSIFGMAFGVGVSTNKNSGAGSVSIAETTNTVRAVVGQSAIGGATTSLSAPTVTVSSNDKAIISTIAGQVNVSTKDKAVGGAFAYNAINNETLANVDTATITARNSIKIQSTEDAEIESISAAAGLAKGKGVALSASMNFITNTNKVLVKDSTLEDGAGGTNTVSVKATDTSKISSLAGSAGVSTTDAGAGAAFSLNQVGNTNYAGVDNSTVNGASTLEIIANENATIRTLAGALGAGEKGFSGSLSINNIGHNFLGSHPNTTIAELKNSTVTNGGGTAITVKGKEESTIDSLAGAVAIGTGGTAAGGAIADNNIQTTAKGSVSGTLIENSNSLLIRGENTSTINSASLSGSGASGGSAFAGSASSNRTQNKTNAELINSEVTGGTADVDLQANNNSTINALAGGAAVSFSATAVGIAIAVNKIDDETKAFVAGKKTATSKHAVKNLAVDAVSETRIKALSIGAAGGSGNAGAGSVAVNNIDSDTFAYINESANVLAQNNVSVTAESDDQIIIGSGGIALSASANAAGVSFTINDIASTTKAYIEGNATRVTGLATKLADTVSVYSGELKNDVDLADQVDITSFGTLDLKDDKAKMNINGIAVNASSSQSIENISATLGASSGIAAAASASVNVIGGATQAYVLGSQLNQDDKASAGSSQQVAINASNVAYDNSFVGGVAAGANAAGISIDSHSMERNTEASIIGGTVDAKNAVSVKASAIQGVSSLAIGGALGGNAGAGTLSLSLFTNTTDATVSNSTINASALDISAKNRNDINVIAGAGSVGASGSAVGASVAVTSSDSTTTASLEDTTVLASGDVSVDAANKTDIKHIVISGAGGLSIGVAGMADVNLITDKTEAKVSDSNIGNADNKVASAKINATHNLTIDGKAGAVGVGLTGGGVGAGAGVHIIKARTLATVTDSSIYASGLTEVTATSVKDIDSTALTAGIGAYAGIGGGAIVTLIGDDVKDEGAAEVNKDGTGTLSFVNDFTTENKLDLLPTATGEGAPEILTSSERAALNSKVSKSTTDVTGSAGGYEFRTAAEVIDNTVNTGSLNVIATDKTDTKALVGGLGVSLGGGVGGAVAYTTVKANVAAIVSGTTLTSTGDINIKATADKDNGKTADVLAIAGGAGSVGIGAAVSYIDITNNVDAKLLNGANAGTGIITVTAEDKMDIDSDAKGAAIGGYAAGVVVSDVEKSSTINASVSGVINAGGVTVTATDEGDIISLGQSAAAGISGAGSGAVVTATDGSTVKAQALSNTTFNLGSGSLNLLATATPRVEAEADGVAVSGGLAIGASISDASTNANIQTVLGNSTTVNAGGLSMTAQQLRNGTYDSAKAKSFGASGGLLLGASAT